MLSHVCLLKVDLRFLLHSHRDFKWRLFKPKLGTFSAYLTLILLHFTSKAITDQCDFHKERFFHQSLYHEIAKEDLFKRQFVVFIITAA